MIEFLCGIAFIAQYAAFCLPDNQPVFAGYVEGDYAQIAPIEPARITAVYVGRGDRIDAGAPIASLDDDDAELAVRNAQAGVAEARARFLDLRSGPKAGGDRRHRSLAALRPSTGETGQRNV